MPPLQYSIYATELSLPENKKKTIARELVASMYPPPPKYANAIIIHYSCIRTRNQPKLLKHQESDFELAGAVTQKRRNGEVYFG